MTAILLRCAPVKGADVVMQEIQLRPTGIQEIDRQHHQLVDALQAFLEAVQRGYRHGATFNALEAVFTYARTHFAYEEAFLAANNYPKLQQHIQEHQAIVAQLNRLQADVEKGDDIVEQLAETIQSWILEHIHVEDMEYSRLFS